MSDIHPQLFTSVTWKTRHRSQNPYLFKWSLSVKVQIYLLLKQGHLRCKADSLVFKFKARQLSFWFAAAVPSLKEQIHRDLVSSFKRQSRPHSDYRAQHQAWSGTEVSQPRCKIIARHKVFHN